MADIIAFPARNTAPAAPAAPATPATPVTHAASAKPRATPAANETALPSLFELTARMRDESRELTRSLGELQTAVRELVEADLPGEARALVAETLGDAQVADRR